MQISLAARLRFAAILTSLARGPYRFPFGDTGSSPRASDVCEIVEYAFGMFVPVLLVLEARLLSPTVDGQG